MVKHTQKIRRQIAHELFEYVWPFWGVKFSLRPVQEVTLFQSRL